MLAGSLLFASIATQSCLDYDDPGDEANLNMVQTETTHYVGNVDSIPYLNQPTYEGVAAAIDTLKNKYGYFGQCLSGIYMMRGGKEGQMPAAHAYLHVWYTYFDLQCIGRVQRWPSWCIHIGKECIHANAEPPSR